MLPPPPPPLLSNLIIRCNSPFKLFQVIDDVFGVTASSTDGHEVGFPFKSILDSVTDNLTSRGGRGLCEERDRKKHNNVE